jgi:hypothetical protein
MGILRGLQARELRSLLQRDDVLKQQFDTEGKSPEDSPGADEGTTGGTRIVPTSAAHSLSLFNLRVEVVEFLFACSRFDRLSHGGSIDGRTRREAVRFDHQRLRVQSEQVFKLLYARFQHSQRSIARGLGKRIGLRSLNQCRNRGTHKEPPRGHIGRLYHRMLTPAIGAPIMESQR